MIAVFGENENNGKGFWHVLCDGLNMSHSEKYDKLPDKVCVNNSLWVFDVPSDNVKSGTVITGKYVGQKINV